MPIPQSEQHYNLKVAIYNGNAYWVDQNTFWSCPVEAGVVKRSMATPLDTTQMSEIDINTMFEILDALD